MTKRTVAARAGKHLKGDEVVTVSLQRLTALEAVARAAKRDGHPDCPCDTCRALSRLTTPKRAARGKR